MMIGTGMNLNLSMPAYGMNNSSSVSEAEKDRLDKALPENDPRRRALGIDDSQKDPDEVKKPGKKSSPQECETCKHRKYQDGSDEQNVSFKSASHIAPEAAASAVRTHENMHVANAYKSASQKNGKVVDASVTIKTSVCPECGRTYVSGGVTNTLIRYENPDNPYQKGRKAEDAANMIGQKLDYTA